METINLAALIYPDKYEIYTPDTRQRIRVYNDMLELILRAPDSNNLLNWLPDISRYNMIPILTSCVFINSLMRHIYYPGIS